MKKFYVTAFVGLSCIMGGLVGSAMHVEYSGWSIVLGAVLLSSLLDWNE